MYGNSQFVIYFAVNFYYLCGAVYDAFAAEIKRIFPETKLTIMYKSPRVFKSDNFRRKKP